MFVAYEVHNFTHCATQLLYKRRIFSLSLQMIHPYDVSRKTLKWYKKVAVRLLQMALFNAFTVYRKSGGTEVWLAFIHQVV